MSNGSVKDRVKFFNNFANANKDAKKKPAKAPKKTEQPCPIAEVKLVELVEIVKRGSAEAPVSGVAKDPKKKTPLQGSNRRVMRPPANPARQYINLKKDLHGADKSNPEFDRYIELRARVEWKDSSKKDSLSGKKVYFKATETKQNTRPQLFKVDKEKPGFGGNNNTMTTEATTNADGWTDPVKFYLSQFGGDKYKISAQADEDGKGKKGTEIKTGEYEVWRRFWYQNTVATGFAPPDLSESIETYKNVNAEMVASKTAKVEFTEALLETKETGIAEHTLYAKKFCEKNNNQNTEVAIVGRHNEQAIRKFLKTTTEIPEEPVKAHLMFCGYQWDPKGYTPLIKKVFAKDAKEKTFSAPEGQIIIKPALKGDLVRNTTTEKSYWVPIKTDGTLDLANKKSLSKDHISIPTPRSSLRKFTVTLPDEAVNAGKAVGKNGIKIFLRLAKAAEYLGDSDGNQITVAHVGTDTGGNNTTSHEIGHAFYQAPRSMIINTKKWEKSTEYKKDSDFVRHNDRLYRCLKKGKGHKPEPEWTESVSENKAWSSTKEYHKNVLVTKDNKLWVSLKTSTNKPPPIYASCWSRASYKGNWNKNTSYARKDVVIHNTKAWVSSQSANKGKEPGVKWWELCQDKGVWANSTAYKENDVVDHENNDYIALKDNTGQRPPNDECWKKVYYRSKSLPLGGKFDRSPQSSLPPSPTLGHHPKQYTNERGGSGSHCATGASDETHSTWNKVVAGAHYWYNGTCVMYHAGDNNTNTSFEYCNNCQPYLRLHDMSSMKSAGRT
ncbi:MAG: hypothetical protein ACYTFK_07015 [Planctomycetota bacterium]|jgi:hypothetical protein